MTTTAPSDQARRMPLTAKPLLIDQFMPTYDLAVVHSRVFRAPPEQCFETVVGFDLFQIPAFRVLVAARGLPQRLADLVGRRGDQAEASPSPRFRLRDMPSFGWLLVGERPGRELVFGQVGKPWKPRGGLPSEAVTRAQFAGFDQPGFAKLVESTRVDPYGERSAIVTTETRVRCTDPDSRRHFRRYWRVAGPFSHLLRRTSLRVWASKLEGTRVRVPTAPGRGRSPAPRQVAPGVHLVSIGMGAASNVYASNVYLVGSDSGWTLIDAGWASSADPIRAAAEAVFGPGARPAAILLTHIHPDHSGSAGALARSWQVPVYAQAEELPMAAGKYLPQYAMPLDRWLVAPVMRLLPSRTRARIEAANSITDLARPLPPKGGVPGLPEWEWVPTPGHTPGHVAYLRRGDGVLVAGDAALTVDLNSVGGLLFGRQRVAGPPWYTTWDWPAAKRSIGALADLEPRMLLPGHGRPLTAGTAAALHALAQSRPRAHG